MKPISIIVAIAENNAIGKDNQLLWHLSDDLRRFKKITDGHSIVMGRNTYNSLPRRPLPGRTNIVLTTKKNDIIEGCQMAYSVDEAYDLCSDKSENFIIGGGMIYRQFLHLAQKMYVTEVHAAFDANVFFPEIDPAEWEVTEEEFHKADEKHAYDFTFITYVRRTKN